MNQRIKTKMDNLIDVLIILFFIFSAFGSIFKKKSEQKKRPSPMTNNRDEGVEEPHSSSPFDILDEIRNEYKKKNETANQKTNMDEVLTQFEHSKVSMEDLEINNKIIEQKKEKIIPLPPKNNQNKTRDILFDKASLKQAFILSEILSKPKALNRSGKNLYY